MFGNQLGLMSEVRPRGKVHPAATTALSMFYYVEYYNSIPFHRKGRAEKVRPVIKRSVSECFLVREG